MTVVFGCPVVDRAWVLPDWLAAIDAQGLDDYEIACVLSPSSDETEEILRAHPRVRYWRMAERRSPGNVEAHLWYPGDVEILASARNLLRSRVLAAYDNVEFFFSLDSDIILPSYATRHFMGHFVDWDGAAASPLVLMTPEGDEHHQAWNFMEFVEGQDNVARRDGWQEPPKRAQIVDVIMAAILMTREMLDESRWVPHPQGEDIAWSRAAGHNGRKLLIDPTVRAEHRMHPRST